MCGLFAWTGDSSKKFSWDKFNLLGVYNDSRGGDSCGRFVSGVVEKDASKYDEYHKFIKVYENPIVKEPVVLGHSRKASWGYGKTESEAQPVVVEKDGEIVLVLIHNGTIYNMREIAKKYNLDYGYTVTDSYILAHLIYDIKTYTKLSSEKF